MGVQLPFWFLLSFLCYSLASEELQLLNDLFSKYDKNARPAKSIHDIIQVRLKLTLTNLISLNEKEETMTTNVWLQLEWDDYRLTWNESDYGGIEVLRVSPDKVWLPDIVLENNVDGQFEVAYYANVLISSNGYISWLPPAIFRSACPVVVTYFPFDWQNCTLVFRSKTYNAKEVTLLLAFAETGDLLERVDIDPEAFTENGEWAIKHCPAWKYVNHRFTEDDLQYQEINFGLIIQRKPLFYIVNIIVPCVLISSLVVLVYFLPAKVDGFDVGVTTPLFKNLAHCAPEIKECVEACNFITSSTKDQNKTSAEMENWVMIGKVIDVLCFWGALPLFVVGTLAIFFMGHLNNAPDHPFKGGGRQFPLCTTSS